MECSVGDLSNQEALGTAASTSALAELELLQGCHAVQLKQQHVCVPEQVEAIWRPLAGHQQSPSYAEHCQWWIQQQKLEVAVPNLVAQRPQQNIEQSCEQAQLDMQSLHWLHNGELLKQPESNPMVCLCLWNADVPGHV